MKLIDKFDDVPTMFEGQEGFLGYDEFCEASEKCVEIAEDFAIGFAEWISENYTRDSDNIGFIHIWRDEWNDSKGLLEIYKKENGL